MEDNSKETFEKIDVEFEEEYVEEDDTNKEDVIMVEEEPEFTDEEIDEFVRQLKIELQNNQYEITEVAFDLAMNIAKNSKEYLDNDTYLWTMYTYALKYRKENNTNAERYCYIRMKDVMNAMKGKRPQQKALTFKTCDLPKFVSTKVYEDTEFMDLEVKNLGKQFIKIEIGMGAIFFAIIKFIFKYSWPVSLGMIAIMLYINYRISYKSIISRYIKEQTKACQNFCEQKELILFDLPVYNS